MVRWDWEDNGIWDIDWTLNKTASHQYSTPGNYTVQLEVRDSGGLTATATELIVVYEEVEEPPETDIERLDPLIPESIRFISIIAIISAIIASVLYGATEVGKFRYLLLFLPLYTRINKEDVLNNFIRGRIYEYIREHPGENYNTIKRDLELKNGSLAYHLKTLESRGFIKSTRDGMYKRFYPKDMKIPTKPKLRLSPVQQNILDIIRVNPRISQKDMAEALRISRQVVSYHVNLMVESEVLRVEKDGKILRYFPQDDA
jgi:predicted transcriptional regulator